MLNIFGRKTGFNQALCSIGQSSPKNTTAKGRLVLLGPTYCGVLRTKMAGFWQTRKADMPHGPCQDILKPLQRACTITDVHLNYTKTFRNTHTHTPQAVIRFPVMFPGVLTSSDSLKSLIHSRTCTRNPDNLWSAFI